MKQLGSSKYKVVDDRVEEIRKVVLHKFRMSDVEDPDIYAAQPIYEWQQTELGKWCMENATDLEYHIQPDYVTFGYEVAITGWVSGKHATFWALKNS